MPISFKTETVIVIRPAWRTERGTPVADWEHAAEHELPGCRLQPGGGDLVTSTGTGQARRAVVKQWRLFAPPGADLTEDDRIRRSDGTVYDIAAPLAAWPSPTGALAHLETELRYVTG